MSDETLDQRLHEWAQHAIDDPSTLSNCTSIDHSHPATLQRYGVSLSVAAIVVTLAGITVAALNDESADRKPAAGATSTPRPHPYCRDLKIDTKNIAQVQTAPPTVLFTTIVSGQQDCTVGEIPQVSLLQDGTLIAISTANKRSLPRQLSPSAVLMGGSTYQIRVSSFLSCFHPQANKRYTLRIETAADTVVIDLAQAGLLEPSGPARCGKAAVGQVAMVR